jgi:hypothetical protein
MFVKRFVVANKKILFHLMVKPRTTSGRRTTRKNFHSSLKRHNTENSKQIFPENELCGLSPNIHIHVSVSNLYIPTIGLPFLLQNICGPILGI